MKTMKEVFNGNPCGFSTRMTDEQVRHGQHAINCYDDMKKALQFVVENLGENFCDSELDCEVVMTEKDADMLIAALKKVESI